MKKPFSQVLKGAATATSKNIARIGNGGPKAKPITLPSLESLKVLMEDKCPAKDKEHKK